MTKLHELSELGQAVWYDNLSRAAIDTGEIEELINLGVVGVTSNPSIFEKAIAGSADYDDAIRQMVAEGKSTDEVYEGLVLDDIARTADLFRPIYERTRGGDGFVSLEVSPKLASETDGTIAEARRLFKTLNRPNIMIKVPGTQAGVPAIRTLISEGINVNVTLLFDNENYRQVAEAYIEGLQALEASGGDVSNVASVASFFVSRVDGKVDAALEEAGNTKLQGKIAIANAKVAYQLYHTLYTGPSWDDLRVRGARSQRLLWASTSTKNPAYADTLYVDSLIGPNTVNTVPPSTLHAFLDHGTVARTLDENVHQAEERLKQLADLDIDLSAITAQLQEEGVAAFAQSFDGLMDSLNQKCMALGAGVPA